MSDSSISQIVWGSTGEFFTSRYGSRQGSQEAVSAFSSAIAGNASGVGAGSSGAFGSSVLGGSNSGYMSNNGDFFAQSLLNGAQNPSIAGFDNGFGGVGSGNSGEVLSGVDSSGGGISGSDGFGGSGGIGGGLEQVGRGGVNGGGGGVNGGRSGNDATGGGGLRGDGGGSEGGLKLSSNGSYAARGEGVTRKEGTPSHGKDDAESGKESGRRSTKRGEKERSQSVKISGSGERSSKSNGGDGAERIRGYGRSVSGEGRVGRGDGQSGERAGSTGSAPGSGGSGVRGGVVSGAEAGGFHGGSGENGNAGNGGRAGVEVFGKGSGESVSGGTGKSEGGRVSTEGLLRSGNSRTEQPSFVRGVMAMTRTSGGSMTMKLQPESLGALRIQMSMHNGDISIQFHTSSGEASAMIRETIDGLRSSLAAQGFRLDHVSVQTLNRGDGGSSAQGGDHHGNGAGGHHDAGQGRSRGFQEQPSDGGRHSGNRGVMQSTARSFSMRFEDEGGI